MAFTYLDQSTLLDDWSWSAFHGTRLRNSVAEVRDTRSYCGGIHWGDAQHWQSAYPMPWNLMWIRVHERCRQATVRVRVWDVALDNEAGGTTAMYLCATTIRPDGSCTYPPSQRIDAITTAASPDSAKWTYLTKSATDQTVTLLADVAGGGRPGWVGVLVWTWSAISTTAEDTGTIDGSTPWLSIAELSTSSLSSGVPDRVVRFNQGAPQNAGVEDSDYYLIGYHDTFGAPAEYYAALFPEARPLLPTGTTTPNLAFSTYSLGRINVSGVDVTITPDTIDLPAVETYQIDRPIRDVGYSTLVSAANQMVRCRVPTWLSAPYDWQGTNRDGQIWFGASGAANFDGAAVSTSYVALASANVGVVLSDAAGYDGIVTLYQHGNPGPIIPWRLRMMAYTLGAAPSTLATGTEARPRLPQHPLRLPFPAQALPYDPLQHGMILWARYGDWALRGAIPGTPADWMAGIRLLSHVELTLAESGITYPCEIRLEGRVESASSDRQVLVGAGIASQQRSW